MSRRRVIEKRPILPDPRFGSVELAKFMNHLMKSGKKSIAESIVYKALDIIHSTTKADPLTVFERALYHVKPLVEVKSRRVGGATYQVPVEVNDHRQTALSMGWIIEAAGKRGEKGMAEKVAREIMDAATEEGGLRGKGGAVKKREDTHRMAEANKAYSHYRW